LHQTGTVEDYWQHFEKWKSRILIKGRRFSEKNFIDSFISGLKGEIKPMVMAFKPGSLDAALEYVLCIESAIESQFKCIRTTVKTSPTYYSIPKPLDKGNSSGLRGQPNGIWSKGDLNRSKKNFRSML
jgi:hypothetical protein